MELVSKSYNYGRMIQNPEEKSDGDSAIKENVRRTQGKLFYYF